MENSQDKSVVAKIERMNKSSVNDVHEAITFKDGKLTIQLQVGHPNEPDAIKGCFPTHAIDSMVELFRHYQSEIQSRETALVITKLQEARLWLEQRKLDREKRGVLQTDNK